MGDGGAGDADHTAHRTIDAESGVLMVVKGDIASGDYEVVGPLIQPVFILGRDGHEAVVTANGDLRVLQASGLPQFWTDAAAEEDDTYYDLGTTGRRCTFCALYVETNDAIVSFDGGVTEHFFVDKDAGLFVLQGLDIPAGSTISGKNAVAGADYDYLRVAVW